MLVQENYPLQKLNTFGIQCFTKYFAEIDKTEELIEILTDKKFITIPLLILGGGSNLLFTKNFEGLILKNNLKGIDVIAQNEDHVFIKAFGGENWHHFVKYCVKNNYAGVENLSLIPGNIGASPMQNIGAYGVEIKDVFHELEALNIRSKEIHTFSFSDCKFGYRESVFKNELRGEYIILSVTYRLNKKPKFNTSYGAIEQELEAMGVKEISISAISDAVCNIRNSKLPNPSEIGNAGSFFKNPVVNQETFKRLKDSNPLLSSYAQADGSFKLAAGWLIENCGWKGRRIGDAGVHKNQALVIVNHGEATGAELLNLSTQIMDSVKNKFGINLEREVNII